MKLFFVFLLAGLAISVHVRSITADSVPPVSEADRVLA
jgi:hypothetical protein